MTFDLPGFWAYSAFGPGIEQPLEKEKTYGKENKSKY
jgi:hypothetical protein